MDLSVVPYVEGRPAEPVNVAVRYRECMRNHAAAIGGQAYDGCGEFMPGGVAGSLEALKCAACGCHRNFHRRDGCADPCRLLLLYNAGKAPPPPPAAAGFPGFLPYHQIQPPSFQQGVLDRSRGSETPPALTERERRHYEVKAAREEWMVRKRCRTRFTQEQKEKMQAFAEKVGWRIQKHDEVALEEFCEEVGVKRHVLKVWMHNNKSTHASTKEEENSVPPITA